MFRRLRALAGQPILIKTSVLGIAGILLVLWLSLTPPGLLGKADAVGYAVCHRIPERSFFLGERPTPLCARCSGMYLGALLGVAYLGARGRKGGAPSLKISILLGLFLAAFALDGGNSYLHLFPGAPGLYEPNNALRLVTGTGLGLGIAAVLTPIFHQTAWTVFRPEPALATWKQLLPLLALAALVDAMVWSGNLLLLYPLALLSSAGILVLLTMVYTVVWTILAKQENRFSSLRGMSLLLVAGFATALLQIALIDAGRFWLTGTWSGFQF